MCTILSCLPSKSMSRARDVWCKLEGVVKAVSVPPSPKNWPEGGITQIGPGFVR
ncbi:hypothetical protein ZHAS_00014386 [Anopheles sinensis]|uniref:Uncharacterized protein n=1 Tax=Anopheles sinensis TaxID=74873 RepID=A0A084W846_ANOSI|nr:hypothetical protein ZHAS_00014386 [Anopheles sinensis]